tara:strand:+ start:279 stop:563 length:285 start_codon:yes stop_codon:yes gene_type:complete
MSEPKPIKITMNKLVEDMARKNPKFRKFLEDKKSGKRIRTQPKLPGMKKGDAVVKTVAAKLKKASKAHAGQAKALENVVKKKGGGLMDYYKDIL